MAGRAAFAATLQYRIVLGARSFRWRRLRFGEFRLTTGVNLFVLDILELQAGEGKAVKDIDFGHCGAVDANPAVANWRRSAIFPEAADFVL